MRHHYQYLDAFSQLDVTLQQLLQFYNINCYSFTTSVTLIWSLKTQCTCCHSFDLTDRFDIYVFLNICNHDFCLLQSHLVLGNFWQLTWMGMNQPKSPKGVKTKRVGYNRRSTWINWFYMQNNSNHKLLFTSLGKVNSIFKLLWIGDCLRQHSAGL